MQGGTGRCRETQGAGAPRASAGCTTERVAFTASGRASTWLGFRFGFGFGFGLGSGLGLGMGLGFGLGLGLGLALGLGFGFG